MSAATILLLAAITALGVFLRLLFLGEKSLWLDEISSITFAHLGWTSFARLLWAREGNMAFYYLLLRAWMHLGDSQFTLRLLSVIFGVITIPAMFVFGRDFFGPRCGIWAAFLLAISAAHVRASQWIRSYSLLLLLVVLSSLLFARALQRPGRKLWALYVLVTTLAVYNHFLVGLLILAQWASLAWLDRERLPRKQVASAMAGVLLLSAPAAAYALSRNVGQLNWVANPRGIELYHLALFLAAGGGKVIGNLLLVVLSLVALNSVLGARRAWSSQRRSTAAWRYAFLFACLLLPAGLAFALSFWKPIFFYRYLIISLPAFVLLVARGLDLLPKPFPGMLLPVVLGLSLAAVAIGYRPEEDWQGACQYLLSHAVSGDAVLFNGHGRTPLAYYEGRFYPGARGPHLRFPGWPHAGPAATAYVNANPRVWFVHFPDFVADSATATIESALNQLYSVRLEKKFKAITVVLYENPR